MSQHPNKHHDKRSPWPCERCGSGIEVREKKGRLPLSALFLYAIAIAFTWLGISAATGALWYDFLLALAALLLAIKLVILSRKKLWHCKECGLRQEPRLQPSKPLRFVVLIPTYNNEATIGDVIERIHKSAPDLPMLIVNDGSGDKSAQAAEEALHKIGKQSAKCAIIHHGRNRGKGAALQTGLREALQRGYSHIITLDADGQHFPEDIPSMRDAALEDPTAIWTGARDLSDDNVQGASRFGRSFSNFWLRVQTGVKLVDSQSGFRVYPIAPVLSLGLRASAYDFEVEVLTLGARAGIPLRSKPIGVYYPPPDERVSHFDKLWDNVRISWVNTRLLIALPLWLLGWPHRLSKMQPPANVSRSWSGRSRGGAFGHLIFMLLIRWFGPTPGYWLLRPISFYFTLFFGHARRMSAAFLDVAQKPEHRFGYRFWRSYRHLLLFSQEILDRAVVQVRGAKDFSWTADGRDYLREVEGQGAILLSGHLGNYELGGAFLHSEKMRLSVVMLDNEAEMIKRVHARFSDTARLPNIISTNKGDFPSLEVLRVLRQGDTVALHGDRIVDQRFVLCDFMGKKAPFPTGVFMLAAAAKKPVILTFGFKTGPRTYHFIAEKPREIILPRKERQSALQEHAQWYASRLEFWAKTHPEQWFNFYDFFEIPTQIESEECE